MEAKSKVANISAPRMEETDSVTRAAGRGVVWQFVGAGWQTIVQLGSSMVLARVLSPRDFGIMGMALLAQGLVKRMADMSPAAGVIAKPDTTQADLSTAFWISMALQGVLFLVSFAAAPLAGSFFDTPEVVSVMRVLSVTFLFVGVRAIHGALMRKHLHFGSIQMIEGGSFALQYALSIFFAVVLKMHYWSLVISMVASGFVETCAVLICRRWMPSLVFKRESFRYLFRYSLSSLGTSIAGYFRHNMDYLLVGRLLGPSTLGLYEFAYRIPHIAFNRIGIPVSRVIFPALAKAQASNERLASGYIKTARYLALVLFPALGGLAAVAEPAVAVLWGDKWLSVIVPLQILCFRSAIQSVVYPVSSIFLCKGCPEVPLKNDILGLFFTAVVVVGFGYAFGLVGVAIGMAVSVVPYMRLLWLAFRLTETPVSHLIAALIPPTVAAAISSTLALLAVHVVRHLGGGNLPALVSGILAGVIGYFAIMWFGYPRTMREVLETIHVVLGARRKGGADPIPHRIATPEEPPLA